MKPIYIVTGANGHLGKTIISLLLDQPIEIRGLVLAEKDCIYHDNIQYVVGDVTDIDSMRPLFLNIEHRQVYLIHTAGLIDIQEHVSPLIYNVNVNGTKNVLKLATQYRIQRMLYVSSVHAIPEIKDVVLSEINHFDPTKVVGGYAKTKAEATQLVLDADLETVVVHPSGIIGPNGNSSSHLIQMIEEYVKGNIPACFKGGYDFVDVRDVAIGVLLAMTKGQNKQTYILSNQYYEIKEIFEMINQHTHQKSPLMLPCCLLKIAQPILAWKAKYKHERPLYTRYSLDTLLSNTHFSHQKATDELGYHPRSLEETITDTLKQKTE